MLEIEDWLQDPLRKLDNNTYKTRTLKVPKGEQQDKWFGFHFATRLKLDGADFFLRQSLGAASMPDDLGLPLLAHRQTEWYLEAFFFELVSAYDTLLQELNIIYAYELGLTPDQIRWNDKVPNAFMKKIPERILQTMISERKQDWFYKVQKFRNTATHHYTVPLASSRTGIGEEPLDYMEHNVSIFYYVDEKDKFIDEDIKGCKQYLKNMVKYVSSIWQHMAQEFE